MAAEQRGVIRPTQNEMLRANKGQLLSRIESGFLGITNKPIARILLAAEVVGGTYLTYQYSPKVREMVDTGIHEMVSGEFLSYFRDDQLVPTDNNDSNQLSGSELPSSPQETVIFSPTETPTPVPPPTETIAPTQTPEPTDTPEPPTPTPIPPTPEATAVPIETPSPTATPEPTPEPTPKPLKHVVRPLLFIPEGLERTAQVDEEDLKNIENAMKEVQQFTAEQLEGKTFAYEKPVLMHGQDDLQYYCTIPVVRNQCKTEPWKTPHSFKDMSRIVQEIERQDPTFREKGQVLFIFWVGGTDYGLGGLYGQDQRFAAVGDWTLDAIGGRYAKGTATGGCVAESPQWYALVVCQDTEWLVAHELLTHAIGILPHTKNDGTNKGDKNYWRSSIMNVDGGRCKWLQECQILDSAENPEEQALTKNPFMYVSMDVKK